MMTTKPIDYVTVVEPVLEVTLVGTADHYALKPVLCEENLEIPAGQDRINIVISAVDAKYKGLRFQELSVSINTRNSPYFLAHAYNSTGWFAWVERLFFQTPYYKGDVLVSPQHLKVSHGQAAIFEAKLSPDAPMLKHTYECQELQIYLPKRLRKDASRPHFFYARLEGDTEIYSTDNISIQFMPGKNDPVLNLLRGAHFQITEWRIRTAARHSKSKTYTQGAKGLRV